MTLVTLKITDGPSKFDLMLALFDRSVVNNVANRRRVVVRADNGFKYQLHISGVCVEDGTGDSWKIKGQGQRVSRKDAIPFPHFDFNGSFHTNTRHGSLETEAW